MVHQLKIQSTTNESEFKVLILKPTLRVSKSQIDELAHLYNIHSIIVECIDPEYVRMGGTKIILMETYIYFNLWMYNIGYKHDEPIFNNVRFFIHADNLQNKYHTIDNVSDEDLVEYDTILCNKKIN